MKKKTIKKLKFFVSKSSKKFKIYIKKIWQIIQKPEMSILPGQLAFFMILSLVPIITISGVIASYFGLDMNFIVEHVNLFIPNGSETIKPFLIGQTLDLPLSILLIWMFYVASGGCNSLILTSNQIYGLNHSNWIKRRIKAMIMTLAIVLFLIFLLVFPVFGEKILAMIPFISENQTIITLLKLFKGPLSWLIVFIFIRTLYEFAPDIVRKNSHINIGAIVTTIGWIIVTYIYRYFANNMTTYNMFYGTLSNIAFLMMWIYFMSFVMVIGMILNYGEEHDKEKLEKEGALKVVSWN